MLKYGISHDAYGNIAITHCLAITCLTSDLHDLCTHSTCRPQLLCMKAVALALGGGGDTYVPHDVAEHLADARALLASAKSSWLPEVYHDLVNLRPDDAIIMQVGLEHAKGTVCQSYDFREQPQCRSAQIMYRNLFGPPASNPHHHFHQYQLTISHALLNTGGVGPGAAA